MIDAFFKQWDEDKYLNIGTMLLNNYIQALSIVATERDLIDFVHKQQHDYDNMSRWDLDERKYIQELTQHCPYDVHRVEYVRALREMRAAR